MITGLAATLPHTLDSGLRAQGVPAEAAGHLAGLPPVSTLFATFLGDNPIGHLLGPSGVLSTLPAHNAQTVTGTRFFPELIAGPFHHGLVIVFGTAAVMALVAAHASALRGRRSGTATDRPTGSAKDSTKEQARPAPAAGRPFNPPSAQPPVERIAAAVAERAGAGRVLVTLEGRAGAGKSTLAAAVAAYLGGPGHAVVVHGDDFFHPMPHHERLSMEPEEGYHRLLYQRCSSG
ncbi:hypothetical protein ACH4E7_44445 [Kitasatospora sp. NPDC018058]|uniref:hypothetical protein n=1 Tax=Kitasatospora sp. NPDC018058 TaxID=3364025 RepID=UPI0037C120B4